ncbi:hypothetical protein [Litoribacter populi]|uniref:hypothetical protein n=1 Tax=Litoribacter populi TaxID=2598460 RepID=UPI00117EDDD8|nr:hypothetical protein [Litoribacter populi]
MINFEFPFDDIWGVILLFLLAAILALQVMFVLSTKNLSPTRKAIRMGLNILFLISVAMLILAPYAEKESVAIKILVYDGSNSREAAQYWKDSLGLPEMITIDDYEGKRNEVFLLGHNFQPEDLAKLHGSSVEWFSDFKVREFTNLHWEGILRQGEMQTVRGNLEFTEATEISIHFGDEKLDSLLLSPSEHNFKLQFQAKASGRNELSLRVNGEEKGLIRFFAVPNAALHYNLLFSYPDMEIRRLAEWLGRQGQDLSSSIQTSTEAQQTARTGAETAQFYITEPTMANTPAIKQAAEKGASLLFTNFDNPETQILQINRAFGTRFQLNRLSQEGNRQIESNLTALPYRMTEKSNQWEFFDGAFAYQELGGIKIGVSLLENTFPIAFQGDTVRYGEIWDQIFNPMRPAEGDYFSIQQPVFSNLAMDFEINSPNSLEEVIFEQDTVFLGSSAINSFVKKGKWIPSGEGWIGFADSLEVYVYGEEFGQAYQNHLISHFIKHQHSSRTTESITEKSAPSPWWLFGLIVISASLLWVEPRVNN